MSERDAHETYAVAAGKLHWIAAALLGSLLAIAGIVYVVSRIFVPVPYPPARTATPLPHLQPHPGPDLAAQRARQEKLLQSYEWIDRQAGIARIPIERAMQLLASESAADSGPPPEPRQ